MPNKILIIFGARSEAIKLAPVIKELEKHPAKFSPVESKMQETRPDPERTS